MSTISRRKYRNVGIVIIDDKNNILMLHQSRGWNAPGGKIETTDRSLYAAARREFFEEVTQQIPFSRSEMLASKYRNHNRNCVIFHNKVPISQSHAERIVRLYNRSKVKWRENNDIAFYPIYKIVSSNNLIVTGTRYAKRNRLARFMKKVCKIVIHDRVRGFGDVDAEQANLRIRSEP